MPLPRNSRAGLRGAILAALLVGLCACGAAAPSEQVERGAPAATGGADPAARLGLMSSLPLYWPLAADMDALAAGTAPVPWQRLAMGLDYAVEPLDTLSPIPGLSPDAPETDPLAGLARLAVIQPRGLSPADNVALDAWVRAGGRLLMVLDPALTGDYDLPLGDPRRPVDSAPIPAVVARWGLAVRFDDGQPAGVREAPLGEVAVPLVLAGEVVPDDAGAGTCAVLGGGAAARCRVGKGHVTLIADAAVFEHPELAGEGGAVLRAVLAKALD
jgi:hypothetical protein